MFDSTIWGKFLHAHGSTGCVCRIRVQPCFTGAIVAPRFLTLGIVVVPHLTGRSIRLITPSWVPCTG